MHTALELFLIKSVTYLKQKNRILDGTLPSLFFDGH